MEFPYKQKAEGIAADLRSRIVRGEYGAGDRLPTRAELRAAYNVTSDTLQRALNWLLEEGFVVSDGRRGTFVREDPPHLTNYALLFPDRFLPSVPRNLFFRALYQEAVRLHGERRIRICDGFSGRAGFLEYDSLLEDVRQHRLAGLVFASVPFALEETPLLADDGVPRTVIMSGCRYPHIPAVYMDDVRYAERAAERFDAEGRHHVAVLVNATLHGDHVDALRNALQRRELLLRETSLVGLSIGQPSWAREVTKLLFRAPPSERPDALLVADDNLLEPATRALKEMGLRSPDDVLIIGHTNSPWPAPSHLPALRLGYSVTDMLNACIRNIDMARQGHDPEPLTLLPPMFEEELDHAVRGALVTTDACSVTNEQ